MANAARQAAPVENDAEALLKRTLAECEEAAARLKSLLNLVDPLIGVLPPERRKTYQESADRLRALTRLVRGNDPINDNILAIVKEKHQVSASEVREALVSRGLPIGSKQVLNSLDYLVRRNRIERIGPGRYRDPETGAGYVGDVDERGYELAQTVRDFESPGSAFAVPTSYLRVEH